MGTRRHQQILTTDRPTSGPFAERLATILDRLGALCALTPIEARVQPTRQTRD